MAERDLTHLENLDKLSRKQWAKAAVIAFVKSQGTAVVAEVAARGFDEWLRIATPIYQGHGFKHEDFKAMFAHIQKSARLTLETAGQTHG